MLELDRNLDHRWNWRDVVETGGGQHRGMPDRCRDGRERNTSRCWSDFRPVRSRPCDERMAELAKADDVAASGLRRAAHNFAAPAVHRRGSAHLKPLRGRECLRIEALRVHAPGLVHEPNGCGNLSISTYWGHFAFTTRNAIDLGGVHSGLREEHHNVAHRLVPNRPIEPLHVLHRVALPSNRALRSRGGHFQSERWILREGQGGILLSQERAKRLDGDDAVLLAGGPSPERVLEVLRGDFTEIASGELLRPLREVRA